MISGNKYGPQFTDSVWAVKVNLTYLVIYLDVADEKGQALCLGRVALVPNTKTGAWAHFFLLRGWALS